MRANVPWATDSYASLCKIITIIVLHCCAPHICFLDSAYFGTHKCIITCRRHLPQVVYTTFNAGWLAAARLDETEITWGEV